jgi:hypothetical protein
MEFPAAQPRNQACPAKLGQQSRINGLITGCCAAMVRPQQIGPSPRPLIACTEEIQISGRSRGQTQTDVIRAVCLGLMRS